MIRQFTQPISMLALLGCLLFAQVATVEHGIDHLFHDSQQLCQGFIGLEKSPSIVSVYTNPTGDLTAVERVVLKTTSPFPCFYFSYSIRAPPESVLV